MVRKKRSIRQKDVSLLVEAFLSRSQTKTNTDTYISEEECFVLKFLPRLTPIKLLKAILGKIGEKNVCLRLFVRLYCCTSVCYNRAALIFFWGEGESKKSSLYFKSGDTPVCDSLSFGRCWVQCSQGGPSTARGDQY